MARLRDANEGPLRPEQVERLFKEVVSCCRSLEHNFQIAYLGPRGTYSEAATIKQFGHFALLRPYGSIGDIFKAVEAGQCEYGVVPVENSTEGMVNYTLDSLMNSNLQICGEVDLPIHHVLMAREDTDPENLAVIYSHEQSLAQCRAWLDAHYHGVEVVSVASNAEAAQLSAEQQGTAAIAGELAADQYQLTVLQRNIEDHADNTTRFLVLGKQEVGPSGVDKTSILIATNNSPGALYDVLEPFQRRGISLSRIESRPTKVGNWTYVFFIDFDGHIADANVSEVLEQVNSVAISVRVLGSYPRAVS